MSVLTRKRPDVIETVTVRARLVPIAKNASPMAKNAGRAAKDRADSLMTWAMPYIDNARVWAAPHVERTGLAPPKQRRWPRMLGTMAMLAAAGTAAAAVAMRRRAYSLGYEPGNPVPGSSGPGSATAQETGNGDQAAPEPEGNGQHRMA